MYQRAIVYSITNRSLRHFRAASSYYRSAKLMAFPMELQASYSGNMVLNDATRTKAYDNISNRGAQSLSILGLALVASYYLTKSVRSSLILKTKVNPYRAFPIAGIEIDSVPRLNAFFLHL